jgi:hypothetical protein
VMPLAWTSSIVMLTSPTSLSMSIVIVICGIEYILNSEFK